MFYKLSFNSGVAQALKPGEPCNPAAHISQASQPRFGYCWWFWLPSFRYNGGRLDRNDVLDMSVSWLCLWFSITAWPKQDGVIKPWYHSSMDGLSVARRGRPPG